MLSITSPQANATVSSTSFDVSGTCDDGHQVTVKLKMPSTQQFHDYDVRAAQGTWKVTVTPWGPGAYKITATCTGMDSPIPVDVTAEAPVSPPVSPPSPITSPPVSPPGGGSIPTGS